MNGENMKTGTITELTISNVTHFYHPTLSLSLHKIVITIELGRQVSYQFDKHSMFLTSDKTLFYRIDSNEQLLKSSKYHLNYFNF